MTKQEKTLRLGVVGTNFVSDWLVQAVAALQDMPQLPLPMPIQVTAVYSRAAETGAAFAAKHGIPAAYTDYAAMLDAVDAVYIASPNFAHAGQAVAAARAGKHILCEKVIATNKREFDAMRSAARENGVVLLEAMRPVHDPAMQVIRDALPAIGQLRRVDFEYCQYSSRYDKFLAGQVMNAFDPTLSNAAIMDIGVYCIAVCAHLFGAPRKVQSASAFLSNGFEASGSLLLDYGSFAAQISYSKVSESILPSVIQGEKGSITIDKLSIPRHICLHPYTRDSSVSPGMQGADHAAGQQLPYAPADNNMVYQLADFARLIADGAVEHSALAVSAIQMDIIDEVRRQNGIVFPADKA